MGGGGGGGATVDDGESDLRRFRLDRLCGLPTERAIQSAWLRLHHFLCCM